MKNYKSWASVDEEVEGKAFHQIIWYIDRPLTLKQWAELDDKMSDILNLYAPDEFWGYAGPIPFDDWYEEVKKIYDEEKDK